LARSAPPSSPLPGPPDVQRAAADVPDVQPAQLRGPDPGVREEEDHQRVEVVPGGGDDRAELRPREGAVLKTGGVAGAGCAGLPPQHSRVGGEHSRVYRQVEHTPEGVERALDGGGGEPAGDEGATEVAGRGAGDGADRARREHRQHVPAKRALAVGDRARLQLAERHGVARLPDPRRRVGGERLLPLGPADDAARAGGRVLDLADPRLRLGAGRQGLLLVALSALPIGVNGQLRPPHLIMRDGSAVAALGGVELADVGHHAAPFSVAEV
jgi:hypothetical protein